MKGKQKGRGHVLQKLQNIRVTSRVGELDEWVNGRTSEWVNGRTSERASGRTRAGEWTDKSRRVDGQWSGRMRTNRQANDSTVTGCQNQSSITIDHIESLIPMQHHASLSPKVEKTVASTGVSSGSMSSNKMAKPSQPQSCICCSFFFRQLTSRSDEKRMSMPGEMA